MNAPPSGAKTESHDAWSLVDILRTDGHGGRLLLLQDEPTATLCVLGCDEIALIGRRTALGNQLIACLREDCPVALAVFDDWTCACAWALIAQFPVPGQLQSVGKHRWGSPCPPSGSGAATAS